MSIEKLTDESRIIIEQSGFVQVSNVVVEHIKDNDAFRVYAYLLSKSSTWKVAKEWTLVKCGIGQRKGKQVWAYLNRCGLLGYLPIKDSDGKITKWDVLIKIGTDFKPEVPFIEKKTTGAETAPHEENHRCKNAPGGETTRVDIARQRNKDINERKIKETKERATAREKRTLLPADFMPDMEAKALAESKGLDVVRVLIKFKAHVKSEGWLRVDWQAAFLKWVNDERVIATLTPRAQPAPAMQPVRTNEVRSNVKFWEPGNPDYDRKHGVSANNGHASGNSAGSGIGCNGVRKAESYFSP